MKYKQVELNATYTSDLGDYITPIKEQTTNIYLCNVSTIDENDNETEPKTELLTAHDILKCAKL